MKKLFAIPLLTGLLLLTGCNQEDPEQASETTPEENQQETEQNSESDDKQDQQDQNNDENNNNNHNNNNNENNESSDQSNESDQESSDPFDKGRATTVLTEYEEAFKKVISYTNDELKQQEYTTKQQLQEHFQHFMSEDLAQSMVDTYFREEDDGLYVIATEGPTFLAEDKTYTFTKNEEGSATVTQERENQLIGHVEMEYNLTKKDGFWIVEEVTHKDLG